jgi:steroid 5-alpha reductase family enzyme
MAVYAYATIPFGLRFSNLTHRGILANGPYRFCKNPAYVSKNLSWWMIFIPFIASSEADGYDSIRRCILLLGLNFIYFMRARTEEKHLSKDPVYIEYATKMNRRSIFAWLGNLFPVLQFKPHKLLNI